jgi:RNA polymerase sigma-70 factor, ECF subfamily
VQEWRPESGEADVTQDVAPETAPFEAPFEADEGQALSWDDVPQLMDELNALARQLLRSWPHTASLQPTLLVNTALRRQRRKDQPWEEVTWANRAQLFGQVFRAMHQKLVEHRRHQRTRAYAAQRRISVTDLEDFNAWRSWTADADLAAALQVGLDQLRADASSAELARIVEYRFFAGLTWEQIAQITDCAPATAKRHWRRARLLIEQAILRELQPEPECEAPPAAAPAPH